MAQKSPDWISPVMVEDRGDKERKPSAITDDGMTSNISLGRECSIGLWFFLESGTSQICVSPGILALCSQLLLKAFTGKS